MCVTSIYSGNSITCEKEHSSSAVSAAFVLLPFSTMPVTDPTTNRPVGTFRFTAPLPIGPMRVAHPALNRKLAASGMAARLSTPLCAKAYNVSFVLWRHLFHSCATDGRRGGSFPALFLGSRHRSFHVRRRCHLLRWWRLIIRRGGSFLTLVIIWFSSPLRY